MTPLAIYISIAKDVLILVGLGFGIYLILSHGEDLVRLSDMQAVTKQLVLNEKVEAQWREEQRDAEAKRSLEMAGVTASINANSRPVYVLRGTSGSCPVREAPTQPVGGRAGAGGADQGSGSDLRKLVDVGVVQDQRPALKALELKFEDALSRCRVLDAERNK